MFKFEMDFDRDSRAFTDACATVAIMSKDSFEISFKDVPQRWLNVWVKIEQAEPAEPSEQEYVVTLTFETKSTIVDETFRGPWSDSNEVMTTMLDRVTYWCDSLGMYNG